MASTHSCSHHTHCCDHCASDTSSHEPVIQDYYWRDYNRNQIPNDALEGAEGKYIGQVNIQRNLLPACIDPCQNDVIMVRSRKQIVTENIKILCTPVPHKFYWEDVDFSCKHDCECSFLKNIVKGGFEGKYDLYIGKAHHMCEWKIGKVLPKEKKLTKGLRLWKDKGVAVSVQAFSLGDGGFSSEKLQIALTMDESITKRWTKEALKIAEEALMECRTDSSAPSQLLTFRTVSYRTSAFNLQSYRPHLKLPLTAQHRQQYLE
ncbi:hypothetical protein Trydic_g3042 [Trypoxylus dichotomus]